MHLARLEAKRYNLVYIGTELILLALANEKGGITESILQQQGIDPEEVRAEVEGSVLMGETPLKPNQPIRAAPLVRRLVELAAEECRSLGMTQVGPEHLFMALMREHSGVASEVIDALNIDRDKARRAVIDIIKTENSAVGKHEAASAIPRQADAVGIADHIEEEPTPTPIPVASPEPINTHPLTGPSPAPSPAHDRSAPTAIPAHTAPSSSSRIPKQTQSPKNAPASHDDAQFACLMAMKAICEKYLILKATGKSDAELLVFLAEQIGIKGSSASDSPPPHEEKTPSSSDWIRGKSQR